MRKNALAMNLALLTAAAVSSAAGTATVLTRPEAFVPEFDHVPRGSKGKRPHRSVGTKAHQRAAVKTRNRARHRKASR